MASRHHVVCMFYYRETDFVFVAATSLVYYRWIDLLYIINVPSTWPLKYLHYEYVICEFAVN
jgi:hypothetical protein